MSSHSSHHYKRTIAPNTDTGELFEAKEARMWWERESCLCGVWNALFTVRKLDGD